MAKKETTTKVKKEAEIEAKAETEAKVEAAMPTKKAPETLEELRARPYPQNIITYFAARFAELEKKLDK